MINLIKRHLDRVEKRTFKAEEILFSENEPCNKVAFVISGEISRGCL